MSDTGRKDLSTSLGETLTPDSQKSGLDKAQESITNASDSVAAAVQPGDSKSTSQRLSDESGASGGGGVIDTVKGYASDLSQKASDATSNVTSGGAGSGSGEGKTLVEQAQEIAANAFDTASKTAQDIANKITGSGPGTEGGAK